MDTAENIIENLHNLPSLSPVLAHIGMVTGSAEVSASEIADALKLDPAIAGKVLRLANSAYIGIPRTVSSVHNAVVILGQRRIHALVLASGTLGSLKIEKKLPFQMIDFWRHSITAAIVAESIARHIKRYDAVEEGELFCAGILHDIGKLVLARFCPERITTAYRIAFEKKEAMFLQEDESLAHFTIGALLAQKWNFPPDLRNAILYHHDPQSAEPFTRMAAIVHLADIMAHMMGFSTFPGEPSVQPDTEAASRIRLQPERLRVIAHAAVEDTNRIESLIEFIS